MFEKVSEGYTYDDLYLVPNYSEVKSRKDPSLKTSLSDNLEFDVPIMSSNMATISEHEMIKGMMSIGATGSLHRFLSPEAILEQVKTIVDNGSNKFGISIGVNGYQPILNILEKNDLISKIGYIVIDVAHGHHVYMKNTIHDLRSVYGNDLCVVAGNICTERGAIDLAEWGANVIRVGIGPGRVCKTRVVTGFGYPQLSAVNNVYKSLMGSGVKIIADGGIRSSGDIVKSLAAGADMVMLGGMLAGYRESPSNVITMHGTKYKMYEGMASINAQADFFNKEAEDIIPEGETTMVLYKGSLQKGMRTLIGSVKVGLSLAGCSSIKELQEYASMNPRAWVKATNAGINEAKPHGVNKLI